jgi:hypothetical protein
MTATSPEPPARLELTSNERRMLRLLAMLPAPHRVPGDGLDVRAAQEFWTTMSEHLSTRWDMEGKNVVAAVHAGALIEECLIGIREGLEPPATVRPEGADPAFGLRVGTRHLALRLFDIFGELSDRQFVALGKGLLSPYARNPSGLTHEWLRQLRETALNVLIEARAVGEDAENAFDHLDKIWGRPSCDERVFPVDLDGERARVAERARQRKLAGA